MIPKRKQLRKRHKPSPSGMLITDHPSYRVWAGIMGRCTDTRDVNFHKYGAKGISVCKRWMDFWSFVEDMGEKPTPSHSIDRIDNEKGYEPGNCRWATRREQTLNRSTTKFVEFRGITKCLTDWAREIGMSPQALFYRLNAGWDIERAFTTPTKTAKGAKNANC